MTQPPHQRYRPHPWHGLDAGTSPPDLVNAYIEITPFDLVKYEVDKRSGFLRVDRPQRTSSTPPTLYGFIPRTLCGARVAKVGGIATGDGDPLDICVLSERPIDRVEVILETRVLGGLLMEDTGQADDKIVAVLKDDAIWSEARDIGDLPPRLVERLRHYFLTYKMRPGEKATVQVGALYGVEQARSVVAAAMEDYREAFPG
ncbi:MAG: inorganic pyrophosphatase [Planctomycetes bacterium]|nr:inorganic pyrophosphatase [Planctomycetota bacterium]